MRQTPLILLGAMAALSLPAQQQPPPRLTVVIDASRGGSEYGARIDSHTYEKQVTLDLANRLRTLLVARDFNVVLTRDSDTLVTNEQRAAVANQNKPIACLLLHATGAGTGLHLWTSSLAAMPVGSTAVLWDQAQAPFSGRSQRLASEFAAAFNRSKIAVSSGHTWIRPLDNMQCPAVALEVAPEDSDTPSSDRKYQARLADVIASQVLFWRGHGDVIDSILNPPAPPRPSPAPDGTAEKVADKAAATATPARTRTAGSSTNTPGESAPAAVPRVPRPSSTGSAAPPTAQASPAPRPKAEAPPTEAAPQ